MRLVLNKNYEHEAGDVPGTGHGLHKVKEDKTAKRTGE